MSSVIKVTPEFAEIIGLLCAEGCHIIQYSSFWSKERDKLRFRNNHRSERIEFYNKDLNLLYRFKTLLSKEFGYNIRITKRNKLNICNRRIIGEIIDQTELGHLVWKVPHSILRSNHKIKIAFIRGYFDGDGTASGNIRMFSCNKSGLLQVSCLLKHLKIRHTFQGPATKENRKPAYTLQVSRKERERFLKTIKPISKLPGMRG